MGYIQRVKLLAALQKVIAVFKEPSTDLKKLYRIEHKIVRDWDLAQEFDDDDGEEPPKVLVIIIKDKQNKEIGHANFLMFDDDKTIAGKGVAVENDHQRKGLASWMYWYAQKVTGYRYVVGDSRTELGDKFLRSHGY